MDTLVVTIDTETETLTDQDVLLVDNLCVTYDTRGRGVAAVRGVDLQIRRGERVALVGESGSGKSATCLAIGGFLTQRSVNVTYDRLDFAGVPVNRRQRSRLPVGTPGLSMVFQDAMTSLDPVWTIESQLRAALRSRSGLGRKEIGQLATEWLHQVGLHDTDRVLRSRPYELSGGMRQRVMLALALCSEPALVIADEPTSALDASLSREVMELLVALTDNLGTALLIVTHDLHLAQDYADRMVVMYHGRIVEEGPSSVLREVPTHPYTAGLLRSIPTLDSAGLDELPTISTSSAAVTSGCSFMPRCDRADDRCSAEPPYVMTDRGGRSRCWKVEGTPVAAPVLRSVGAEAK